MVAGIIIQYLVDFTVCIFDRLQSSAALSTVDVTMQDYGSDFKHLKDKYSVYLVVLNICQVLGFIIASTTILYSKHNIDYCVNTSKQCCRSKSASSLM
jgi:hypothetical protein